MIEHDYHQDLYDHQQCAGSEQCLPTQRSQSTLPSPKRYFFPTTIMIILKALKTQMTRSPPHSGWLPPHQHCNPGLGHLVPLLLPPPLSR